MRHSLTVDVPKVIAEEGSCIIEGVLQPSFIRRAKTELETAIRKEVEYHKTEAYSDYGMVLLCSLYGGALLELFENDRLMKPFNTLLGEGCTVYAYTSSSMAPGRTNYSGRIHVDCPRFIPGYVTNVGATILLDDFTLENGATWYLPASHLLKDQPSAEYFEKNAKRVVAPAGSVWFFNARVWHAGGINSTASWRHALTINMCRPWMKQRIDIPRAMSGMNLSELPDNVLQKLGFHAQVPCSYDEYYVPPEKRKYRQKTE